MPYLQQNTFPVFAPPAIPKAKHLDVLGTEQFLAFSVVLELKRCSMLESV